VASPVDVALAILPSTVTSLSARPVIRRAYIRSVIDQVEVNDDEIRTSAQERP
jgi:hypothetical protein